MLQETKPEIGKRRFVKYRGGDLVLINRSFQLGIVVEVSHLDYIKLNGEWFTDVVLENPFVYISIGESHSVKFRENDLCMISPDEFKLTTEITTKTIFK